MASLMFLGLNPLFVSPRDEKEGKPDPISITSVAIPSSSTHSSKNNKRKSSKLKRVVSDQKARKLSNMNKSQKNQSSKRRSARNISPRDIPRARTPKAVTAKPRSPRSPKSSKDKSTSPRHGRSRGISNSKSKSKSQSKSKSKSKSINSKQLGLSNNDNNDNNNNNQIQINNNYLSLTYNHNHHEQREKSRSFISHSGSSETSDAESDRSDISITAEMNETDDGNIVYQILTKQRNEAIEYSQRLESKLAENDVQFAVKLDQFKQQLKQYKNTNQYLKTQNVSLQREIQKLKDKLMALELNQHKSFDGLLKKRKKINSNKSKKLPNYIRKDFKQQEIVVPDKIAAEKRKNMTQRLNELRFISEQQQKHYQHQYQIQIQDIDEDIDEDMDEDTDEEREKEKEKEKEKDERPFIKHVRSPTESTEGSSESSLSACAVNLSFPAIKTPLTHYRQLTTILEHKSIPQTMLGLIQNSDDNIDINNEWGNSSIGNDEIDDDDDDEIIRNHNQNQNNNHNVDIPQMCVEQISMDKRQISVDTERTETTGMHSESMSYMSNNTNMLKELSSMNTIDETHIDNEGIMDDDDNDDDDDEVEEQQQEQHKNVNDHNKTATMIINNINLNNDFEHKLSNYSANYSKQDLDEHDQIITSPIKISGNQSFKVRL